MTRTAGTVLGTLFLAHAAAAQFIQQGSKLVGSDAVGTAFQGRSVAISADGATVIVGGPSDNNYAGASWVFTRSSGLWSQQGTKLVGTGAVGGAQQGSSVAISADGDTVIVAGLADNTYAGAAWVFTRSGGVWSQQGAKLVGSDAVGGAWQGTSVAISADGNTAIVGGYFDHSLAGAAWVYTRSGGVWAQQGPKLVGIGAAGAARQGSSVAISADGNTAIVGGFGDNSGVGAIWVFARSGGVWSQQGSKLVGTGGVASPAQGYSAAISADGDTAIVGGQNDNLGIGAAWVFTRRGGVWSQQGSKLVGTGAFDPHDHILQGSSVTISAEGNTAIVGGAHDNGYVGAAWVYARSGGVWLQQGSKVVGTGAVGPARQGYSAAISAAANTAIVGGENDNSGAGAAWVFVANGCTGPSLSGQPQNQSIQSGQTATLSVAATGTTPLSYQWYRGASGDTATPVGTNASSFTTPVLTATTSYWVRVSNSCGHADSASATITIGSGCTSPSITTQPQSQAIASGRAATLSVTATGTTPVSYQWYQGNAGDTSTPVGGDVSTFTTPPLMSTARFWVRVTNACGTADSATATIAVRRGVRRHLKMATWTAMPRAGELLARSHLQRPSDTIRVINLDTRSRVYRTGC